MLQGFRSRSALRSRVPRHENEAARDHQGRCNFDGVKAHATRDVEFSIGVMHAVRAPEQWHNMKQTVLKIDDEIEQQHRAGEGQPRWRADNIKHPQPVSISKQCDTPRRRRQASRSRRLPD